MPISAITSIITTAKIRQDRNNGNVKNNFFSQGEE